jgi:hypothetical protein
MQNEIKVFFAFLLSPESYIILKEMDELILRKRAVKNVFGRSDDQRSSFYPKLHFISSGDVDGNKFDEVVSMWQKIKPEISVEAMSFRIKGLELVGNGLLFLKLETNESIEKIRKSISDSLNT